MSRRRSNNFIQDNLALCGFGDRSSAFFQTVKELVDNGIDAISLLNENQMDSSITIDIKNAIIGNDDDNNNQKLYSIEVCDTGIGMHDPRTCFTAFHTTASSSSSQSQQEMNEIENESENEGAVLNDSNSIGTTGTFGVGLTAILLYTLQSSHGMTSLSE